MAADQSQSGVWSTRPRADGVVLLIVVLMLMVSGLGLWAADWTDHLAVVPAVGVVGVAAGSLLAMSRFRARTAAWLGGIYGVFVIGWQVGRVLEEEIWRERILELLRRASAFAGVVLRGERNADPIMFVLLMAGLYWWLGVSAAWSAVRLRGLWRAAVPAGLALAVNAFYAVGYFGLGGYLAGYVLLTLLLAVRLHLAQRQEWWRSQQVQVPPGTAARILEMGLMAAGLLVVVSWGGPAFAQSDAAARLWSEVSQPWGHLRDRIGDAFGNLRSPVVLVSELYGEDLTLEAGTEPGQEPVIVVALEPGADRPPRFYWRARVYDTYQDGRWSMVPVEQLSFLPEEAGWQAVEFAARDLYGFRTTVRTSVLRTLYLAAQPVWVGRPAQVSAVRLPDGNLDVVSVAAVPLMVAGESYLSRAAVAVPTADQLRASGTNYPSWVRERYLQLPDTLTPRTVELAQNIGGGLASPYDQALAVTGWLRTRIRYKRNTPAPPSEAEPIDWFLFDSREGFCDYYASAAVILLRLLGVPARLSAGLAEGLYDPRQGVYQVRASDAHAWPEVFFPGYGWVEFEPTASQPPLVRPEARTGAAPPGRAGMEEGEGSGPYPSERFEEEFFPGQVPLPAEAVPAAAAQQRDYGWLLAFLGALAVTLAIRFAADPYLQLVVVSGIAGQLRRLGVETPEGLPRLLLAGMSFTGRTYLRWSLWLRRLGFPLGAAQTPHERAALFAASLPASGEAAWPIVEQYGRERYGGHAADEAVVRRSWSALEPQLWRAWFRMSLAKRGGPPRLLPRGKHAARALDHA